MEANTSSSCDYNDHSAPSITSRIKPGISHRNDFPLEIQRCALLIIDIQEYLSSPHTRLQSSPTSKKEDSDKATERPHGDCSEDPSSINCNANKDGSNKYLFETSLPNALSNISKLLFCIRTIRNINNCNNRGCDDQGSRESGCGGLSTNTTNSTKTNNTTTTKPEIVWTYLQSLTNDRRDVSTDYKLSGEWAVNIPTPSQPAKFLNDTNSSTSNTDPPTKSAMSKNDNRQLSPLTGDEICIPKTSCSVFMSTNIHYVLTNIHVQQLVICGQLTNQCVESTVRDAADLGYLVTLVQDACAAKSLMEHDDGIFNMRGFARVLSSCQVIQELEFSNNCNSRFSRIMVDSGQDGDHGVSIIDNESSFADENDNNNSNLHGNDVENTKYKKPSWLMNLQSLELSSSVLPPNQMERITNALFTSLAYAKVRFICYAAMDCTCPGYGTSMGMRCKSIPLKRFLVQAAHSDGIAGYAAATDLLDAGSSKRNNQEVFVAEACFAGMNSFQDGVLGESGLSAANVLLLKPDFASLRILPYCPSTAMVFSTLHDQEETERVSPLCTRSLLSKVVAIARAQFHLQFTIGAEIEFCLFRNIKTNNTRTNNSEDNTNNSNDVPVDKSLFAQFVSLAEQSDFVNYTIAMLEQLNIDIEQIHAESAHGQFEIVLCHLNDPIMLADHIVMTREEGILTHLPALLSFTMPSDLSFARVGPGCWTGASVGWATEDKEQPLRVCLSRSSSDRELKATNIEYKLMDSMCNIYLAMAMILCAGLDGIAEEMKLRPSTIRSDPVRVADTAAANDANEKKAKLPVTLSESLNEHLLLDELLMGVIGRKLSRAYVATKLSECRGLAVSEELKLALERT